MVTQELKKNWNLLVQRLSNRFSEGEMLDLDGVLFIIGLQEVGLGYRRYKKDGKPYTLI